MVIKPFFVLLGIAGLAITGLGIYLIIDPYGLGGGYRKKTALRIFDSSTAMEYRIIPFVVLLMGIAVLIIAIFGKEIKQSK